MLPGLHKPHLKESAKEEVFLRMMIWLMQNGNAKLQDISFIYKSFAKPNGIVQTPNNLHLLCWWSGLSILSIPVKLFKVNARRVLLQGFYSLLLKESAFQWRYDLCRMVMVSCRNIYPCIKVTPNQNRLECDPNHLQMLCWWSGLCRMIIQGLTKPALVGLVLAGASDWVSM